MTASWLLFVIAYLLGSIPFGLILTQLAGTEDIRKIGSGNIGATNVLRTGNKKLAAATLLLDALKGTVAVLMVAYLAPGGEIVAGFCALLGHMFPIWLGFKGGKGVATYLGALFAIHPLLGLLFCAVWLAVFLPWRFSSLASILACASVPIAAWWMMPPHAALGLALMSLLVVARHLQNIRRLLRGEELKFGK